MNLPKLKIDDFCKTGSGGTPSRKNTDYYKGQIPWVKSGDLRENVIYDTEEYISEDAVLNSSAKMVSKGAILLAMYGATVGRMARLGVDATTNQAVCHIIPDPQKADTQYLYYALLNQVPQFLAQAVGGAQPNINQGIIKNTEIYLPPISTQTQIAKILDKSTALIAKRKAQIAELDVLVQSVFLEMFGDPITNSKGWELVKFIDVVKLQRGFDLPVQNRIEGKYNVWGSNGIVATHSEYKVKGGGIITGRSGSIGNVYYTKEDYFPLNTTLFSVDTKGNNIIYLTYLVKNFKLERFQTGTGVPTLNRNNVHEEYTICVPFELQTQFAQIVEKIQTQKSQLQQSLAELEMQHQALMQRAFKGELV